MKNKIATVDLSIVSEVNHQVMTTSLVVAEKFGKRHADVLRAINNLPNDDYRERNFAFTIREIPGPKGAVRQEQVYQMTWKGFSILAMGFNGTKAYEWKQKFLDAFEAMANEIGNRVYVVNSPEWLEARQKARVQRLEETDIIKEFVDYAKAKGSAHPEWYYKAYTSGVYKALFILDEGIKESGLRDKLNSLQLYNLAVAERVAQQAIREAMGMDMYYKDIYKYAVGKVCTFVDLIGGKFTVIDSNIKVIK